MFVTAVSITVATFSLFEINITREKLIYIYIWKLYCEGKYQIGLGEYLVEKDISGVRNERL